MNANDSTSTTTPPTDASSNLSSTAPVPLSETNLDEAPLIALITGQGLKPVHLMSEQELLTFVRRLREMRTAAVQARAEIAADEERRVNKVPKGPKKERNLNLDEYV